MLNLEDVVRIIKKEWGVDTIQCPFGSCTEKFADKKMIDIAIKNNFPDNVIKTIKEHPIKFPNYQKYDNGRGIGRYYINLITDYYQMEVNLRYRDFKITNKWWRRTLSIEINGKEIEFDNMDELKDFVDALCMQN